MEKSRQMDKFNLESVAKRAWFTVECDACHQNNSLLWIFVSLSARSLSIQLVRFIGLEWARNRARARAMAVQSSNGINNGLQINWRNKKRPTMHPFTTIDIRKGVSTISRSISPKYFLPLKRRRWFMRRLTFKNCSHICSDRSED